MLHTSLAPSLAFSLLKQSEETRKLSNEQLLQLYTFFGNVLTQAVKLLENCKIIQYHTKDKSRSIYKIGINLERYTIYKDINYCSCPAFKLQVLEERSYITCKHVLAVKLNEITKNVKVWIESVTDSQFVEFLNEQLNYINE